MSLEAGSSKPVDVVGGLDMNTSESYNSAERHLAPVPAVLQHVVAFGASAFPATAIELTVINDETATKLQKMKLEIDALAKSVADQKIAKAIVEESYKQALAETKIFQDLQTTKCSDTDIQPANTNNNDTVVNVASHFQGGLELIREKLVIDTDCAKVPLVLGVFHGVLYMFIPVGLVVVLNYLYFVTRLAVAHRSEENWAKQLITRTYKHPQTAALTAVCTVLLSIVVCKYSFMVYTMVICATTYFSNYLQINCENFEERLSASYNTVKNMVFTDLPEGGHKYARVSQSDDSRTKGKRVLSHEEKLRIVKDHDKKLAESEISRA